MKKLWTACAMSFSMFCAMPSPFHVWNPELQPLTTLFLPAVGAWIGVLWSLLALLLRFLALPRLFCAALLCAFPFAVTGGMHIDGYLDVTDAVKSWRDLDERRRILKDPHSGSFALIACALLVMMQFALFASAGPDAEAFTLLFIAVVSRALAGLCVTALRPMATSEYAGAYRRGVKRSHIVIFAVVLALAVGLSFLCLGRYGFASLAVIAGYLLTVRRAVRSLDGMSGDISGYALTVGELCGIAVYALI